MKALLTAAIRAYQYALRPWWGRQCRFTPSCSDYAIEAIGRHGAARGSLFSARRLACCHPWHAGGFDPVP